VGQPARALVLSLAVGSLGLLGCRAERSLRITSTPPGAELRLDDQVLGHTPVEVPFIYYGVRRVTLSLPGYRTLSQQIAIEPPLRARFPLDLFTEVLLPLGWEDHQSFHLQLEPGLEELTQPDLRSVLERAEALRRAGPEGPRVLPPIRTTAPQANEQTEEPERG